MDITSKFLNLSGTYLQIFYIYQGPTFEDFKFIRDLLAKFLNLSGTYLQSFKFLRDLQAKFINLIVTYL